MANNKAVVPLLVGGMLLTGVTNTILTKLQDRQCVAYCDTKHPKHWEAPVLQSLLMFIGEASCWVVILVTTVLSRRNTAKQQYTAVAAEEEDHVEEDEEEQYAALSNSQTLVDPTNLPAKALIDGEQSNAQRQPLVGWRIILLALPAVCDIIGTTLMNVGLILTAASIYQMTRGALVLFVGLFSVIFLKRHLGVWKWLSLFIVVAGVAIVGLAGIIQPAKLVEGVSELRATMAERLSARKDGYATFESDAAAGVVRDTLLGVLLIAGAQIFTASQFVLEESIMERYTMNAIAVVSWEGTFGALITLIGMLILHAVIGSTPRGAGGYFDAVENFRLLFSNQVIGITSLIFMFSIAGFNFFGLSVTRQISATARSTIDTSRVLFIWLVSLGLGWETLKWLQILGFAMLCYGTFLFNDVVSPPTLAWLRRRRTQQAGVVRLAND